MKKMIFGLIATVLVSVSSFGQYSDSGCTNVNNPFDWVGQKHNEHVVDILKRLDGSKPKSIESTIFPEIERIAQSDYGIDPKDILKQTKSVIKMDSKTYYSLLQKEGKISSELNKKLNSIVDILDSTTNSTVPETYNKIKNLDESASKTLKGEELNLFYATASVARHTTYLWFNIDKIKDIPTTVSIPSAKSKTSVSKEDVKGAVAGAVGGLVTAGTLSAPAAAVGAVTFSVAELVGQAWDWFWGE